MRKSTIAAAICGIPIALLSVQGTQEAQAAPRDSVTRMLKITHSPDMGWIGAPNPPAKCIDSNFDGAVYLNACDFGNNRFQQWYVYRANAKGYPFKFRNVATGRCLEGYKRAIRFVPDYWDLKTSPCNDSSWQQWWARGGNAKTPGAEYRLQSRADLNEYVAYSETVHDNIALSREGSRIFTIKP